MMKEILLLMGLSAFSWSAYAKTQIVLAAENTTPEDFHQLLVANKNYVSLIEDLKMRTGAIDRELLQEVHALDFAKKELRGPSGQESLSHPREITSGFLSPLKSSLLKKVLKSSNPALPIAWKNSEILHAGMTATDSRINPVQMKRSDDQIYINGNSFSASELKALKLAPFHYYHVAYLSNAFEPSFQWALGKDLKEPEPRPLLQGDCTHSRLQSNFVKDSAPIALFPNGCLKRLEQKSPNDSLWEEPLASVNDGKFSTPTFRNHRPWLIGGLALLAIASSEIQKRYDLQISWYF
jgi:hypothetical protein